MNDQFLQFGLKPLPPDPRDFKLGAVYDLPKLSELPADFIVGEPTVVDQKQSDFCTMAATAAASELQEGVPLGFEWMFAVGKMIDGEVDTFGLNLRTACKVHAKYGAIERADSPYSIKTKSADFLRRIENWPENLFKKGLKHRKASYFKVEGPYDPFDDIRATIWKFRAEKRAVVCGVIWSWPKTDVVLNKASDAGEGHAMVFLGWKTIDGVPYIVAQNSYGKQAGEKGRHYLSREVVNRYANVFGAFTFSDLDPDDVRNYYLENGIKVGENWMIQLLKVFRLMSVIKNFAKKLGYGK